MAKPALNDNARYSYRYLMEKYKLQPYQAAGIVGNLMQESTFNTGARNAGDGSDGSDSIGIGQWNGDRARNFRAFAGDNTGNLDTQLDFVMHEMNGEKGPGAGSERYAWNKLQEAKDVHGATAAMISYERPSGWKRDNPTNGHGFDNRLAWAGEVAGLSPEEIAAASPTSSPQEVAMLAQGKANVDAANAANPNAGKPYEDGLFSFIQNKINPDSAPKQPANLDADGNVPTRGFIEQATGGKVKMPEKVLGVSTNKAVGMLGDISKLFGESDAALNAAVPKGGRTNTAPVELMQDPAKVAEEERKKQMLKPYQLIMAMSQRGGLGGLGGIGRV